MTSWLTTADAGHDRLSTGVQTATMRRIVLVLVSALAVGAALAWRPAAPAEIDPDLARLLRYMALLKAGFAAAAFGLGWWRLGRPAQRWREAVYVAAPGLMASGALALGQLHAVGLATVWLHAGLFGFLAAALTDEGFIPARLVGLGRRRARR